ncbi:MAG TPA: APC family permease [candidate division Zixibacteria bacterium]|nr:APC family permease [candidate division Zixibacteria bacterium]
MRIDILRWLKNLRHLPATVNAADDFPQAQPRRELGPGSLVALTFFCVAGGAFGLEDGVGAGGPMVLLLALLLLPWVWSYPTALMTAELSSAMPENGGYVAWVEKAFGRFWGFQEGWLSLLCGIVDNALYPVMFVDYLAYLGGDLSPAERWLIGAAVTGAIAYLNVRGSRPVGWTSIALTVAVLAPFAAMVVLGVPRLDPGLWLARPAGLDWALLLSVVLWNTSGWDNAGCCAGEVADPGRNYPRAMAAAVLLVTLAYVLPIAVGAGVDGRLDEWREGHFPNVAARIGGSWLGVWLTLAGLASAAGLLSALLCTSSRVCYAMALRGMLPSRLASLHPRYGTPHAAIVGNALAVACLVPFSFQELIQVDMFLYALALVLEFAAFVRLRRIRPDMPRPYRVPVGLAGAVAFSAPPVLLCLASIALAGALTQLAGLAAIASGAVVYAVAERGRLGTAADARGSIAG